MFLKLLALGETPKSWKKGYGSRTEIKSCDNQLSERNGSDFEVNSETSFEDKIIIPNPKKQVFDPIKIKNPNIEKRESLAIKLTRELPQTKDPNYSPPPEKKEILKFKLLRIDEIKKSRLQWETKAWDNLDRKVNSILKYYHKLIKKLEDEDSDFAAQFLSVMKIDNEAWINKKTNEKIQSLLLNFEKLTIICRHCCLLKQFDEKCYRKIYILIKGYLKIFYLYKVHFKLDAIKFLEKYNSDRKILIAFRQQIQKYGFKKLAEKEEELIKVRMRILIPKVASYGRT